MAEFLSSAYTIKQIPNFFEKEVAIIGRSNVGKSSLVNLLCKRKDIAKVSKKPGATVSINFFQMEKFVLVDLPGYGYAKINDKLRDNLSELVPYYLTKRNNLILCVLLIDARRSVLESDLEVSSMLNSFGKNFIVAVTKTDKVNNSDLSSIANTINEKMMNLTPYSQCIFTSSKDKYGHKELYKTIADLI